MCFVTVNTLQTFASVTSPYTSSPIISPQYISFIPDGLQRPPSIFA